MVLAKKNLLLAIACGLIALLAFAACGGGDDDDESGDDGGNNATATRTADSGDGGDDDSETPTEDGGDDGGSDSGDAPEDVCSLLTADEASLALDGTVSEGVADNNEPFYSCTWETEDFDDVTVQLLEGPREDLEFYFSLTSEAEEIVGMGDKAQYTDLIGLEVITDHYVVTVTVFDFDLSDEDKRDLTLGLGDRVLGRLDD